VPFLRFVMSIVGVGPCLGAECAGGFGGWWYELCVDDYLHTLEYAVAFATGSTPPAPVALAIVQPKPKKSAYAQAFEAVLFYSPRQLVFDECCCLTDQHGGIKDRQPPRLPENASRRLWQLIIAFISRLRWVR
jgi:hypothetical protein